MPPFIANATRRTAVTFFTRLPLAIRHESFRLGMRNCICRESKSPFVLYFPRGSYECSQGGAGQSPAHADPLYSGSRQFFNGKRSTLQTHHDVDGLENRRTNLSDRFKAREPRRIQNVGASLSKGLQSPYGVG